MTSLFLTKKPRVINKASSKGKQAEDISKNLEEVWQKSNKLETVVGELLKRDNGQYTGKNLENLIKLKLEESEVYSMGLSVAMS